jgi:hypothetical protein
MFNTLYSLFNFLFYWFYDLLAYRTRITRCHYSSTTHKVVAPTVEYWSLVRFVRPCLFCSHESREQTVVEVLDFDHQPRACRKDTILGRSNCHVRITFKCVRPEVHFVWPQNMQQPEFFIDHLNNSSTAFYIFLAKVFLASLPELCVHGCQSIPDSCTAFRFVSEEVVCVAR